MRRPIFATLGLALATLLASCALAETLLVVRKSADALDFVDPGSGLRLATVELGHAPHEVSVAPDGRRAAVSNYGTRERPGSTLSIVDLEQPREILRIDLRPHTRPHGVDWFAPDRIAVTTEGSQHLLVVDPDASRIVLAVPTAQEVSHMVAVAANATRAFVANIGSGSTTAIDLAAGRRLRDIPTGKGSEAIALSPDGRELWVGAREVDQVVIVDTDSLEIEATLAVPGIPIRIALAPDGHTAFVTCAGTGELVAIDTATRRARARAKIDVPMATDAAQRPYARLSAGSVLPVGLLVSRDGRSVYVAATMGDAIAHFDAATVALQQTTPVGGEPDGLGLTPVLPRAECHACAPDQLLR